MRIRRFLLATTIVLLFWLPLPLGSNRLWAVNTLELLVMANAALCILAWMFGWLGYRGSRLALLFCLLLWGLWLTWIAVQFSLWPADIVEQWASHRYELEQTLAGIGLGPAAQMAPSIERDLTRLHWHESFAYACLFFTIMLLAAGSRSSLRILAWALLISGVVQAGFGSAMLLTGIEYNLLGPKTAYLGSATGTFVNRNHFAGYLELTAAVAIGLMVLYTANRSRAEKLWRRLLESLARSGTQALFIRIALIIIVIGLILSQSRMGNAAALGGLLVAGMLYALLKKRADWRQMLILLAGLLVVDLWLVGDWFGVDRLAQRYEETDIESSQRAQMLPVLIEMGKTYMPVGSGLGTFEVAYPEFHSAWVRGRPRHAHNDYMQFFIETGLPGMALIGVLVLATFIRALLIIRNRRDPTYTGMAMAGLMAMACIGIHSLTDFNLQIPANAATLVAIMALVWSSNPWRNSRKIKQKSP